jgi:hypothetical protein
MNQESRRDVLDRLLDRIDELRADIDVIEGGRKKETRNGVVAGAAKELFFVLRSTLDYALTPIVVRDEPPNHLIVEFVE